MNSRISEIELILPSLLMMTLNDGKITTSELIIKLREILNPQGEDLKILDNRKDDKFSQKVRNLTSHRTLEKFEYAIYQSELRSYKITQHGREYLQRNMEALSYILNNHFEYKDVIENLSNITQNTSKDKRLKVEPFEEDRVIHEGIQKFIKSKTYERSNKLKKYAIEHFADNGIISCKACNFIFEKFYGQEIGKGFIEIHHIKPVFQYEGDDANKTISQALHNVIPLCSNCHRMVHRKRNITLGVSFLKCEIEKTGSKIIYNQY